MSKRRLLIIGWDGADWQIAKPLMEAGRMPNLSALVSQGVMGNLASMEPMISPMLWTTIATGKPPHVHGICGFYEPAPETELGIQMASSSSRKCKALWNILSESGFHTSVMSWYSSHPAEPVTGINVSDRFAVPTSESQDNWPLVPGAVQPPEFAEELAGLRVHPNHLSLGQFEFFVPDLQRGLVQQEIALPRLATAIAECSTVQSLTTAIMQSEPWEVMMVYLNTIDTICHSFMIFHPPQLPHVPEQLFRDYQHVVNSTYCLHDLMLGRLMELVDDDTAVMILSDHGYQTGLRRARLTPSKSGGPSVWHRPYGVFALKAPGVRKDELIFGARLLDIAPTVLTLMGLPVGQDMTGRVLTQAFETPPVVKMIPSWEETGPKYGGEVEHVSDPFSEQAAYQQLVELGYIESLDQDKQKRIAQVSFDHRFNHARSLLAGGHLAKAAEILEALHSENPERLFPALTLADCYQRMRQLDDCRRLIDFIANSKCYEACLENDNARMIAQVDLMYGLLEMNCGNNELARTHFERAAARSGLIPEFQSHMGEMYLRLKEFERADEAFTKALEIDEDDRQALNGKAAIHLHKGRNKRAVTYALRSLEVLYHQPAAHFLLGMALKRTGEFSRAKEAMEICLHLQPNNQVAQQELDWLAQQS
jgi:predicted AlkP superfamily phosphohydrolase/phosphomutase/tetratricopeptide (TPR) repeat protein